MTLPVLVRHLLRRYRLLFAATLALLFLHEVLFFYIFQFWKEQTQVTDLFLQLVPGRIREGIGIPLTDLTDPRTFHALVLLRPDFRLLTLLFGVAIGTDVIAGELGRGTSELLLSHPVRRTTLLLAGVATMLLHFAAMFVVLLAAFAASAAWFPMGAKEPPLRELAGPYALVVSTGATISLSAFVCGALCRTRARAVGWSLVCVVFPMVLVFIGLFTRTFASVAQLFPEKYYRPHFVLMGIREPSIAWCLFVQTLIGACYLALALWIAKRRDLLR